MPDFVPLSVTSALPLISVMAEPPCPRVKLALTSAGSVNVTASLANGLPFPSVTVACSLVIPTLLAIKLSSVTLRLTCAVSVSAIKFTTNCSLLPPVIDAVTV